jgi:hypothetical protein
LAAESEFGLAMAVGQEAIVANPLEAGREGMLQEAADELVDGEGHHLGLVAAAIVHVTGLRLRLHDFRHRFAVQTLMHWYRTGDDPERRLPILSTYLGHAHVTDTYWYLTGTPELLGAAGRRLEKGWEGLNAGRS